MPERRLTSNSYESGSTEVRLQSYILHVADPDAWRALPASGLRAVFLPANFAPSLHSAFVEILDAFYALEYRYALGRCAAFYTKLTAAKNDLGIHYNCTVTSFCAIRSLLHGMMGYYTFPDDLPDPIPPHLQPIEGDGLQLAPEYVAFRLASAFFSEPDSKEAICASLGWTFPQLDAVLRDNVKFFVRYALHYAPTIATRRNINDIEVSLALPLAVL